MSLKSGIFWLVITLPLLGLRAEADPVLIVSDGVNSSGVITLTGGSGTYVNEDFSGSWSVVITTGESKPVIGSATSPNMELDIVATSLGSTNPLTVTLSDNNFGPIAGNNLVAQFIGQAFGGVGDVLTFNTYSDANNSLAALTSPLTTSGNMTPDSGGQYLSTTTNSVSLSGPFSLSEVVRLGGAQAATYSLSVNLQSAQVIGQPSVTITYPTNGQVFIAPATFNVMASANDTVGTITNVQFLSSTNGTDFIFIGQTNNKPYLTIASNLPTGTYTFVAKAADDFGATAQSAPVTVQVVPPESPSVNVIGHLKLNLQDGYQWLSNVVCNPVNSTAESARVYIHNITNSAIKVVNASGTTNGLPYIQSPAAIQPGTCWTNVIKFYDPVQAAFFPTLTVELVPVPNAAGNPTGLTVPMLPPRMLADGTFLVEFPSTNGGVYYVQYSSDMLSWNTSFPAITGTGQHMQWIDSGPPATASLPAANVTRFYRVIQAQ
jgi:hypothetical protein